MDDIPINQNSSDNSNILEFSKPINLICKKCKKYFFFEIVNQGNINLECECEFKENLSTDDLPRIDWLEKSNFFGCDKHGKKSKLL